jgi:hypothetical protein
MEKMSDSGAESCWITMDLTREPPLWRLELLAYDDEHAYDVAILGPQGLLLYFSTFSRDHVQYEEDTKQGKHIRVWYLATADGTPVQLGNVAGHCTIYIGAEGYIHCDIPPALFEEFATCMTLPLQAWHTREGWARSVEVDSALVVARQRHARGEGRQN